VKSRPAFNLFSQHEGEMNKRLIQVSPDDFDVQQLLLAAREGRLYVEEKPQTVSRETVMDNVRVYVRRISSLVTCRYRGQIDALWEDIFHCDLLMDLLMPKPKARKCRDFDKYGVMRIIGVLRVKGVYEQRSDPQFDALLEEQGKDSPYRRYLGQGLERHCQLVALRRIVEAFSDI